MMCELRILFLLLFIFRIGRRLRCLHEAVAFGSRAQTLVAVVVEWAAWPGSKTPSPVVPYTMRLQRQTVRRKAPGSGGGEPFAGAGPPALHEPLRVPRRRSSLMRLIVGSRTWSKASGNPRMKHQKTLAESVGARRCGQRHYCSAMSPGEHRSCAMRLAGMSVAVETGRVCASYLVATPESVR